MRPEQPLPHAAIFNEERASNYDQGIRFAGIGYDVMHDLTAALLGATLPEHAHLLIIGAGTGEEIIRLAPAHPGWCYTAVDPSPAMLAIARQRIAAANLEARVELITGTVDALPAEPVHDAATILLVMHFLGDDGDKLALLREVATRLRPGAPVVLSDMYGATETPEHARFLDAWRHRQLGNGMAPADVDAMFQHIASDLRLVSGERLEALMTEAGFASPLLFFKALLFGGWIARRAPSP